MDLGSQIWLNLPVDDQNFDHIRKLTKKNTLSQHPEDNRVPASNPFVLATNSQKAKLKKLKMLKQKKNPIIRIRPIFFLTPDLYLFC
jgi:hypothetical protein